MRRLHGVGSLLAQRLRRWPTIEPPSGIRMPFAGKASQQTQDVETLMA